MSKTVLVVDDSGSFRMVVKVGLERAGYQVVDAADGQAALLRLDGVPIDLVICDLNMPDMDGLTFVRHLRESCYSSTPVIMLTSVTQQDKRIEGHSLGVRAWITKPFLPSQLTEAVRAVCPL